MTNNYDSRNYNAVYALNSYVFALLRANVGWTTVTTPKGEAVPIIPIQQQPEMLETGKPFIVYGTAQQPGGHLYAHKRDSVSYMIYGNVATEVNRIADLLADTFERQDEAAQDVNRWLAIEGQTRPAGKRKVSFTSASMTFVERAEPAEEENGLVSALVLLAVQYVVDPNATIVTNPDDFILS